jgi:hypothetical protein
MGERLHAADAGGLDKKVLQNLDRDHQIITPKNLPDDSRLGAVGLSRTDDIDWSLTLLPLKFCAIAASYIRHSVQRFAKSVYYAMKIKSVLPGDSWHRLRWLRS